MGVSKKNVEEDSIEEVQADQGEENEVETDTSS